MKHAATSLAILLLALPAAASVREDIQSALLRAVTDAVGDDEASIEVSGWKASRPELVRSAKSLEGLEILPGEQPYGHVTARARLVARDGSVTPVFVLADVSVRLPVWVVTRSIASGGPLDTSAVASELRPIDQASDALRSSEALEGRLAARALRPGSVLRASSTTTPVLVKSGEQVSVRVIVGAVRVSSRGEALGSGRAGDRLRVRLSRGGPVLEARVSGPGSVEVSQ